MNNSRNYAYFTDLLPSAEESESRRFDLQAWVADYPELGLYPTTPASVAQRIRPYGGDTPGD